jgi:hypothetical protein
MSKNKVINKCQNPSCGRLFEPNKFRPDQKYCDRKKCRNYGNNLRQQRYYNRHRDDEKWQREQSGRKKRERKRREEIREEEKLLESSEPIESNNSPPDDPESAPHDNIIGIEGFNVNFFKGFMSYQTGFSAVEDVDEFISKCCERGKELRLDNDTGDIKKNESFLTSA